MYPELSMQEIKTTEFIRKELKELGVSYIKARDIGTIAVLDSKKEGKNLLIRADIDALPIKEETGYDFSSLNEGVMHACGHDFHTACLLGTIKDIVDNNIPFSGKIFAVFQPAEEVGKGAQLILDSLKGERIDEAIGVHIGTETPFGRVNATEGKVMSGIKSFEITIKGKGGHASRPDETQDVIQAMVSYISMATRLKERKISPFNDAVLTFAGVHGGVKSNIIPSEIKINGSIRYFEEVDGVLLQKILLDVSKAIDIAHSTETTISFTKGSRPLVNDSVVTKKCRNIIKTVFGEDSFIESERIMATDDFSKYLEKFPGCYIFIGARLENETPYPVHNCKFNPDERIMDLVEKYYIQYINEYMNN